MKCKDCYKEGCSQRAYTDDAECVLQQWTAKQFDWQSFRAEAAKDILCVVFERAISIGDLLLIKQYPELIQECIVISDELIRQLKEKEA